VNLGLTDKTALVPGSGPGRAICIALVGESAHVVFAEIDPRALQGTQAPLQECGGKSLIVVWNISNPSNRVIINLLNSPE
jgi:hypothetical protein